MAEPKFIHLRVHTAYSLSEGAMPVPKLIHRLHDQGVPAIAITDTANHNKIIDWAVASGWTAVTGHDGYWYRMVSASTSDQSFAVLTDGISTDNKVGSVTVSTEVTKEMVDTINTVATQPTITVTAAAIQQDNVTDLADAWSKLPETFTGVTSGT